MNTFKLPLIFHCLFNEDQIVSIEPIPTLPDKLQHNSVYIGIDKSLFPIPVEEQEELYDYFKSLLLDPDNTQILPGIVKYSA